ncbi:MraY family glycosyltransferase [Flaviflexus salsibiostraticola]|nr:glycosyltransferase family 4 protein [Flaviflexus salsibiostraticola]
MHWLPAVIGGLVAMISPIAFRPLLRRLQIVDIPNERSSHEKPTLRGGGLSTAAGLVIGVVVAAAVMDADVDRDLILLIGAAGMSAGVLGFVEDVRGVSVQWRAAIQVTIGVAMAIVLVQLIDAPLLWIPIIGFAFVAYVNATNFMDGINGISGLHGFVVGTAFAALGTLNDSSSLLVSGTLLACVSAAFLPWNFSLGGMFLGDVGSYLLGGTIITMAAVAVLEGLPVLAVLSPLSIYLADTGATLVKRVRRGERWYAAHRSHVYQQLSSSGLSHLSSALTVALFTAINIALGLSTVIGLSPFIASGLMIAVAMLYLHLPRVLRQSLIGGH